MTPERTATVFRIAAEAAAAAAKFGGLKREELVEWIIETGDTYNVTRAEAEQVLGVTVGEVGTGLTEQPDVLERNET